MEKLGLTAKTLEGISKGKIEFQGRIFGGNGFFAEVSRKRTISFALKYRRNGKERRKGLGKWPSVTLEDARRRALLVDREADPHATSRTFNDASDEWLRLHRGALAQRTVVQIERYLDAAKARFGDKDLRAVRPSDVLSVLREFEGRGAFESAKRARIYARKVFSWAIDPDDPFPNPASNDLLKDRLAKSPKPGHHAAMPADEIPEFLRNLAADNVHPSIRGAITLVVLTGLRTGEVLELRWTDIEAKMRTLTIPGQRMKAGEPHTVFLSKQAQAVLTDIKPFSGEREFVFPGRDPRRPLSNMAMLAYVSKQTDGCTVHGFRSSFSSWSNSAKGGNARAAVVERCLAHSKADKILAAYDRNRYDEEAAALWQKWANYCTRKA